MTSAPRRTASRHLRSRYLSEWIDRPASEVYDYASDLVAADLARLKRVVEARG
ncbi:hypothetical protein AB0J86_01450 [Micromonospora sp. NPDC049559]|uniref:hypothetical protein n=1 Tax=Micromonospora sp. NPDC049559 TaxID=3155923 RepID=UPI0034149A7D